MSEGLSDERLDEIERACENTYRSFDTLYEMQAEATIIELVDEVKRLRRRCVVCRHNSDRWCCADGLRHISTVSTNGLCDCNKFEPIDAKGSTVRNVEPGE